jgi:hypothetical protein
MKINVPRLTALCAYTFFSKIYRFELLITTVYSGGLRSKIQNTVDFSLRQLYVGIDVHKNRWQVAVFFEGIVLSNVTDFSRSYFRTS